LYVILHINDDKKQVLVGHVADMWLTIINLKSDEGCGNGVTCLGCAIPTLVEPWRRGLAIP